MIYQRTSVMVFAALMCSCAVTPSPEVQAKRERIEATRPTCEGEKDCMAKWDAAQLYVVKNANYKIQSATSVLIETFNPGEADTGIAMSVTREPLGAGRYKFVAHAWCNNVFGCIHPPVDVVLDFNRQVAATTP